MNRGQHCVCCNKYSDILYRGTLITRGRFPFLTAGLCPKCYKRLLKTTSKATLNKEEFAIWLKNQKENK